MENSNCGNLNQLQITENGSLKVELIPMPGGDNPWRTRAEYQKEQHRDTIRFWITILVLIVSIVGVVSTTAVAIVTIRSLVGK
jgi:hypothetical protein